MAEDTLTTQTDPQTADSQVGLSDGQESTQQVQTQTPVDSGIEKRFKDTQAAFTKSQQQLKELETKYADASQKLERILPSAERFDKLVAALQNGQEAPPEFTSEQIDAANRMVASTPAFKDIQQKAQAFEQQTAAERSRLQKEAVAQAAEQITTLRKLDTEGQKALREHIESDPYFLAAVQQARNPQEALRAFDRAYRDLYFDKMERNAVAEGTKMVEKTIAKMENSSAIEQPSTVTGTTESIPYNGNMSDYTRQVALAEAAKLGL